MNFYNKDIKTIFSELNSKSTGLTSKQVDEKIAIFGKNTLEKQKKTCFFIKLLNEFKNIMIIILIISAIISITTSVIHKDSESLFEGILIIIIVIINAIVGVVQNQKAENALSALQKSTEPFAKVYRDNSLQKIPVTDIVPGDIIELKSGDIVPADIRLINSNNLQCNESSLTGEGHSISKHSNVISKTNLTLSDQENICFSGTSITTGSGQGIVFATGKNSEIGKIAGILSSSKKEKTPIEKNIDKIGKVLSIGILGIVAIVFVVQIFLNKNQSFLDSFLIAVALAVAAIPESLPAVITIIMALGVQRLAKKNAIIKKLSAVETLGSCNIICSDKTGTLTKNEMTVKHIFDNSKLFTEKDISNIDINYLNKISSICNSAKIENSKITADATETAIIKFLFSQKINVNKIKSNCKILKINEFDSTRKMMSIVTEENKDKFIYAKGAIDYIIKKCTKIRVNNNEIAFSDNLKKKILSVNDEVCLYGERVIAFAYKRIFDKIDEEELVFAGFFGIIDPPREEAKKSIKECKTAGLKVIMITGDHPSTAFAIAKELGIAKSKKEVLTGQEINNIPSSELSKIIHKYSIFARVTPEHKLLIVKALKSSGNIVAMTGDGINDAPSIKQANIGACMGITGTDVTKEVADIIIADDNFSTIVCAIEEGRTIYQNITKTILFLLSTNIVEVLGIFVTSLVIPDAIFLTAIQILFINLITDSLPAFALGIEPAEKNIMNKPPRNPKSSLLSGSVGTSIIYQGFIQSFIVLVMFVISKCKFGNEVASTMSFLTICLMQIIHAINCKTERSIFRTNIFKNKFFNFSFIFLFFLILSVYFVPFLSNIFGVVKLNYIQWIIVGITSLSIIPLVEVGKIFIKEK